MYNVFVHLPIQGFSAEWKLDADHVKPIVAKIKFRMLIASVAWGYSNMLTKYTPFPESFGDSDFEDRAAVLSGEVISLKAQKEDPLFQNVVALPWFQPVLDHIGNFISTSVAVPYEKAFAALQRNSLHAAFKRNDQFVPHYLPCTTGFFPQKESEQLIRLGSNRSDRLTYIASLLGRQSELHEITLTNKLDSMIVAGLQIHLAKVKGDPANDFLQRLVEFNDSITEFATLLQGVQKQDPENKLQFIENMKLVQVHQGALAFQLSIRGMISDQWGHEALELVKEMSMLVPPNWMEYTVVTPDVVEIQKKLLAVGVCTAFAESSATAQKLIDAVEANDKHLSYRFAGQHGNAFANLKKMHNEMGVLVNTCWIPGTG